MAVLILILVVAVAVGGVVGWFSRGRLGRTIVICMSLPFLYQVSGVLLSPHNGFSEDAWIAAFFTALFPFYFILAVPCLLGGILMSRAVTNFRAKRV